MRAMLNILALGAIFLLFAQPGWTAETKGVRASQIVDQEVKNQKGEVLGEVDDLIARRNGRVKKAILQVGGFLGIGDRLVAVQFRSLRITPKEITYPISKEQLEKHPVFDYAEEGLYGQRYWYFGFRGREGAQGRMYSPFPSPYKHPYAPPWEWNYFPDRFRISPLLDSIVLNFQGERLGTVKDLIINPDGQIDDAIVLVGEYRDPKDRLVALPFKDLEISYWGIYCNRGWQQLKDLPTFHYRK